jgi:hypothetical protein
MQAQIYARTHCKRGLLRDSQTDILGISFAVCEKAVKEEINLSW